VRTAFVFEEIFICIASIPAQLFEVTNSIIGERHCVVSPNGRLDDSDAVL